MAWKLFILATLVSVSPYFRGENTLDFARATVCLPSPATAWERRVSEVLVEEIRKRTGLTLPVSQHCETNQPQPSIILGERRNILRSYSSAGLLPETGSPGREGFDLIVIGEPRPVAVIAGADSRGLLRAYYDAVVQRRLLRARALEAEAIEVLEAAGRTGSIEAIDKAGQVLMIDRQKPVAEQYRGRCIQLSDSLFESIGLQLSVERHGAIRKGRGAFIDSIDAPLNDAVWLLSRFRHIRRLDSEKERQRAISCILERKDPGPGGFYDNYGSFSSLQRVLTPRDWDTDPGTMHSVRRSFGIRMRGMRRLQSVEPLKFQDTPVPLAWLTHLSTIFDQPLRVRYENLDPGAHYRIIVVYPGRIGTTLQLEADGYPVHDFIRVRETPIVERPVPEEATEDGEVIFSWTCGDADMSAQVAEVQLLRKER